MVGSDLITFLDNANVWAGLHWTADSLQYSLSAYDIVWEMPVMFLE